MPPSSTGLAEPAPAVATSLRQRLLLLSGGLLASGLLGWTALALAESLLGIRDPEFRYENKLDMWRLDRDVGFVNAPSFEAYAWGTVAIRTDARGFRTRRGGPVPTSGPRIVGIGDSVMWGTGVDAADSLLGQLEARLRRDGPVHAINAGVVGYSSLQSLRFLEKFVLPLEPDVVLLNFCNNDLLPTEDPFGNVRAIHAEYLRELLARVGEGLDAAERRSAQQTIALLNSNSPVWPQIEAFEMPRSTRDAMVRLLVERPIVRMVSLVRATGGRMLVLIIPPRSGGSNFARSARSLSRSVRKAGGEVVDLTAHLALEPRRRSEAEPVWFPLLPALERILRWRGIQVAHAGRDFLDFVHPSRRGNAVVADRIAEHLRAASWWTPGCDRPEGCSPAAL